MEAEERAQASQATAASRRANGTCMCRLCHASSRGRCNDAIAALAGSLLVARLGVRAALVGGLTLVAAGSALRGLSTSYAVLFATTLNV